MNMLETFFTDEDIKEIYDELVIYSIKKYEIEKESLDTIDIEIKNKIKKQYKRALFALQERKINPENLNNETLQQMEKNLNTYQQNYDMLLNLNKNTIDDLALQMQEILLGNLSNIGNELERVSLLFDFATNYFNYSYDCYQYCNQIPFVSKYAFDFKDNIPVDSTYNSTLVMGQGLCGDFANFLKETGHLIGLNMETLTAMHNENYHALNKITFSNGETSFIDVTAHIKDKIPKSSCFLVSEAKLNEKSTYHFNDDFSKTVTIPIDHLDTTVQAINLANELKKYYPNSIDLNRRKNL